MAMDPRPRTLTPSVRVDPHDILNVGSHGDPSAQGVCLLRCTQFDGSVAHQTGNGRVNQLICGDYLILPLLASLHSLIHLSACRHPLSILQDLP